jgi:hypothetical protein
MSCLLGSRSLRGWQTMAEGAPGRRRWPRADKPKGYEPARMLQEFARRRWTFAFRTGGGGVGCCKHPGGTASATRAGHLRYLAIRRKVVSSCTAPGVARAHMNNLARILAVRTRLRQRALPYGAPWRRLGEYAGGGICAGCGERITSAQASYAVDFLPEVVPTTVRFHRGCFEIWQQECQLPLSPQGN